MTPEWFSEAACRGLEVELFLGVDDETPSQRRTRQNEAVRVCAQCPVRGRCLELALTSNERYGVWGGTTEAERQRLIRERAA